MHIIYRVLILMVFFFAAIACYVFGVPAGGAIFLLLGFAFEAMFWLGVFGRKRAK